MKHSNRGSTTSISNSNKQLFKPTDHKSELQVDVKMVYRQEVQEEEKDEKGKLKEM